MIAKKYAQKAAKTCILSASITNANLKRAGLLATSLGQKSFNSTEKRLLSAFKGREQRRIQAMRLKILTSPTGRK